MRWVMLGSPAQPDVHIVLEPPATDPGISASDRGVVQEPMDMPYGTRECAFRDRSGNMIRLIETRA